jgi:hypothetical protein
VVVNFVMDVVGVTEPDPGVYRLKGILVRGKLLWDCVDVREKRLGHRKETCAHDDAFRASIAHGTQGIHALAGRREEVPIL